MSAPSAYSDVAPVYLGCANALRNNNIIVSKIAVFNPARTWEDNISRYKTALEREGRGLFTEVKIVQNGALEVDMWSSQICVALQRIL